VAVKLVADENFKGGIIQGLRRQQVGLDLVRVQDVGLRGADDPTVLEWAAQNNRVLLTHDVRTVTKFAYDRLSAELPMPGIIEVQMDASIGQTIRDILLLIEFPEECDKQVRYVPF
jgi:Domain of unknown function (DUF5615)